MEELIEAHLRRAKPLAASPECEPESPVRTMIFRNDVEIMTLAKLLEKLKE